VFTGLIDDVGRVDAVSDSPAGRELRIACRYDDLVIGESIAVNGACLTVRTCGSGWFTAAAVVTTLGRTTIDAWRVGLRVNLERAMKLGDRLGGHLVQGHVDAVGVVQRVDREADAVLADVLIDEALWPLVVLHGSIAIDGVSLTVNALPNEYVVQLSLIEHTLSHTTLGELRAGSRVHVEADMMGKYAQRLLEPWAARVTTYHHTA
jgi:riboflavin synthase